MLKHVSVSPWRNRADSVSLASSGGSSSSCGSGSPTPGHTPPPSRASSCVSLAPPATPRSSVATSADSHTQQTTIKVYAKCLRPDIEYKTLSISFDTTCREVVQNLLNKFKMRHRDPRLFFLTMEVTVRRANVRTILPLDEDARPAILQSCHPKGDSRFSLQSRRGGLVKVYDSALMSGSKYKSLLISEKTTVDELIQMLLSCYSSNERVEQFSLYEVCESEEYQRKLHPDDSPLAVTQRWSSTDRHLRIRRNPDYNPHRRMSMWASDSSITLAMSKLQFQDSHHQYFNSKTLVNSNNQLAYRHHCPVHNRISICQYPHHQYPQNLQNSNANHKSNAVNCTNNNNNNNNANVNKNIQKNNLNNEKQQQHSQLSPDSQPAPTQTRIILPPQTLFDPAQIQKQPVRTTAKSLPSTPLTTKHISTRAYSPYDDYLFI